MKPSSRWTRPHPRLKADRNRRIREEVAKGRTYQEVAADFGLSRQRVDQIVKPEKSTARRLASDAIACGRIAKPSHCVLCASDVDVEMHHADYSKPLDIVGLCTKCHGLFHGRQPRRTPKKHETVLWACATCGQEKHMRPCDARARKYCSAACRAVAARLTEADIAGRYEAMADRLRRYALAHGYVPILKEFAEHVTGFAHAGQAIPRLCASVDPQRRQSSYRDICDRIYTTAGFDRPDGRSSHVRRARIARGQRAA